MDLPGADDVYKLLDGYRERFCCLHMFASEFERSLTYVPNAAKREGHMVSAGRHVFTYIGYPGRNLICFRLKGSARPHPDMNGEVAPQLASLKELRSPSAVGGVACVLLGRRDTNKKEMWGSKVMFWDRETNLWLPYHGAYLRWIKKALMIWGWREEELTCS